MKRKNTSRVNKSRRSRPSRTRSRSTRNRSRPQISHKKRNRSKSKPVKRRLRSRSRSSGSKQSYSKSRTTSRDHHKEREIKALATYHGISRDEVARHYSHYATLARKLLQKDIDRDKSHHSSLKNGYWTRSDVKKALRGDGFSDLVDYLKQ